MHTKLVLLLIAAVAGTAFSTDVDVETWFDSLPASGSSIDDVEKAVLASMGHRFPLPAGASNVLQSRTFSTNNLTLPEALDCSLINASVTVPELRAPLCHWLQASGTPSKGAIGKVISHQLVTTASAASHAAVVTSSRHGSRIVFVSAKAALTQQYADECYNDCSCCPYHHPHEYPDWCPICCQYGCWKAPRPDTAEEMQMAALVMQNETASVLHHVAAAPFFPVFPPWVTKILAGVLIKALPLLAKLWGLFQSQPVQNIFRFVNWGLATLSQLQSIFSLAPRPLTAYASLLDDIHVALRISKESNFSRVLMDQPVPDGIRHLHHFNVTVDATDPSNMTANSGGVYIYANATTCGALIHHLAIKNMQMNPDVIIVETQVPSDGGFSTDVDWSYLVVPHNLTTDDVQALNAYVTVLAHGATMQLLNIPYVWPDESG